MYEPPAEFIAKNWKEIIMKKEHLIYVGLFLLGVWAAPKVAPSLRKVPVVGSVF